MKEKIKLTELTKGELRQVKGGIGGNVGVTDDKCPCKVTQTFGDHDSRTIKKPKPIK